MGSSARRSEIASLVALVLSGVALGTSVLQSLDMREQTKLMRSQSHAAVWPRLAIDYRYQNSAEKPQFIWSVANVGVGPALVKAVSLQVDGKALPDWNAALGVLGVTGSIEGRMRTIGRRVLPPPGANGSEVLALDLVGDPAASLLFAARSRLRMTICYCSIFDDCWTAASDSADAAPTVQCPIDAPIPFSQ